MVGIIFFVNVLEFLGDYWLQFCFDDLDKFWLIKHNLDMSKTQYTSVTETVARILSLLITLLYFSIYILSKDIQSIKLEWSPLMVHLTIFWISYEVFSFCLFILLQQFASTKNLNEISSQKIQETSKAVKLPEPTNDFYK